MKHQVHPMAKYLGQHIRLTATKVVTVLNINTCINYVTGKVEPIGHGEVVGKLVLTTLEANMFKPNTHRRGQIIGTYNSINIKHNK